MLHPIGAMEHQSLLPREQPSNALLVCSFVPLIASGAFVLLSQAINDCTNCPMYNWLPVSIVLIIGSTASFIFFSRLMCTQNSANDAQPQICFSIIFSVTAIALSIAGAILFSQRCADLNC